MKIAFRIFKRFGIMSVLYEVIPKRNRRLLTLSFMTVTSIIPWISSMNWTTRWQLFQIKLSYLLAKQTMRFRGVLIGKDNNIFLGMLSWYSINKKLLCSWLSLNVPIEEKLSWASLIHIPKSDFFFDQFMKMKSNVDKMNMLSHEQ